MKRAISGFLALRWLRRHGPSATVTRTGADDASLTEQATPTSLRAQKPRLLA
jgi:hypothetical protein